MNANFNFGRVWGIPIGLNVSWFLIFLLVTFSLTTGYFPTQAPNLGSGLYLGLGLITTLLLFGSVLAHELGHSFVALRNKIPVKGITLFIFGGVAQITREPQSPGAEFRIAVAGPLVSVVLAGIFGLLNLALNQVLPYLSASASYLMQINFILALFNLIPGFPLDGGRILRSIVWKFTGSYERSTRFASISGQVVAFGFIGFGLVQVFTGQIMNGIWMIFIGWFLQNAASNAYVQTKAQKVLDGVKVEQAMQRDLVQVPGLMTLNQLVDGYVLATGKTNFAVVQDGRVQGILTMTEITTVPQSQWRFTPAEKVMIPWQRLASIRPDMGLLLALEALETSKVSHVPVVDQNRLVGLLSREQVLRYMRLRNELGM